MNQSVNQTYMNAVEVASQPQNYSQGVEMLKANFEVFFLVAVIPFIVAFILSGVWSIVEDEDPLWGNGDFVAVLVVQAGFLVLLLALAPYLFIIL